MVEVIDEYEGPELNNGQQYEEEYKKAPPQDGLDANMQLTDPDWSKKEITKDLQKRLTKTLRFIKTDTGQLVEEKEFLWSRLNYFTKDMRLGNLKAYEIDNVRYWLRMANICISLEMQEEAVVFCLGEVATILETSQSREGFLRKRQGTITSERINRDLEPGRKNFWNGQKQEGG